MSALPGVPQLDEREFSLLRDVIYGEAGIFLAPGKKALLAGRLQRRLRELGLTAFAAYWRHLAADRAERQTLIEAVTTHETSFFREPHQFQFLEKNVLPVWRRDAAESRRPRRVRALSAGCATGEEPFSLAMVLLASLPGFDLEVLATDISARVLEQARAAEWPLSRAAEIPEEKRKRFMLRGIGENAQRMCAGAELRAVVRFERANLNQPGAQGPETFDLILCRNVLIYFDARSKARAIEGLLARLAPGGLLLTGHAESLSGVSPRVRRVAPTIYRATAPGEPDDAPAAAREQRP